MDHIHTFSSNGVHLYERKYLGNGRYFQRGIAKNIAVGDYFMSNLDNRNLLVEKVLKLTDSKGVFKNPEDGKNSYYEAEMLDENFTSEKDYELCTCI